MSHPGYWWDYLFPNMNCCNNLSRGTWQKCVWRISNERLALSFETFMSLKFNFIMLIANLAAWLTYWGSCHCHVYHARCSVFQCEWEPIAMEMMDAVSFCLLIMVSAPSPPSPPKQPPACLPPPHLHPHTQTQPATTSFWFLHALLRCV